jgi:hypothetical protein
MKNFKLLFNKIKYKLFLFDCNNNLYYGIFLNFLYQFSILLNYFLIIVLRMGK